MKKEIEINELPIEEKYDLYNKWNGVLLAGSFSEDFFKGGRKQPQFEKREELK